MNSPPNTKRLTSLGARCFGGALTTLFLATLFLATPSTHAAGINTDVALTPPKSGTIFRLQYGFSEADGAGNVQRINTSSVTGTLVYGLTQDLAFFLTTPYANRQTDLVDPKLGRLEDAHDGIADLTFLAKYRFWQNDIRPGETLRWAAIGGVNLRSGDSDFTSDSYDPIVGTVFTWQRDRGWFDADLIYQFNTGRGAFRHDVLRYDLAYSYRLFPAVYEFDNAYELDAVAEINGRYTADGSHELFLAPGLQFITERWILETSIQLPVIQELATGAAETDYRFVIGFRIQW